VQAAGEGALEAIEGLVDNPAGLRGALYRPPASRPRIPLVVVLHGCNEGIEAARETGWEGLADTLRLLVLYPEQTNRNNVSRCFNWGDAPSRDAPEVASIISMIDHVVAREDIDPARVFVTGMSAGGAMSVVMLATWPERFAGGAVAAGVPFGCARDLFEATTCFTLGEDRTPAEWAAAVRAVEGAPDGPWPPVLVMHDAADPVVAPVNGPELVEQWRALHGVEGAMAETRVVGPAEVSTWGPGPAVAFWRLAGVGHAYPVDARSGCGRAGPFRSDVGLCAARETADFFGLLDDPQAGDVTPPTVRFRSPTDGAVVGGEVTVLLDVADDGEVARLETKIDGQLFHIAGAAPWSFEWDTVAAGPGLHRLSAVATDAAGNVSAPAVLEVEASRDVSTDETPPTVRFVRPTDGATVRPGRTTVRLEADDDLAVVEVVLEVDGAVVGRGFEPPFTFEWAPATAGPRTLEARAWDARRNVGRASVVIDVSDDAPAVDATPPPAVDAGAAADAGAGPPTPGPARDGGLGPGEEGVLIVEPAPGDTVSGVVTVVVQVATLTPVDVVSLSVDDVVLGGVSSPPYTFDWDTREVAPGAHRLSVEARTEDGVVFFDEVVVRVDAEDVGGGGDGGCSAVPAPGSTLLVLLLVALGSGRRRSRG
jgi:poly(hydroxyalkanoate) depolymerase family esterase